jgi:mono/diheme cytochrome c family protein
MRAAGFVVSLMLATGAECRAGAVRVTSIDAAAGRKLYAAKCASCHKLHDPARYDDKSWKTWMEKMRHKARLNDEQYKHLSEYLQSVRSGALPPVSGNAKK